MKLDLTITITAILGIAAIISPIATAIINNRYQLKLKKIELQQKHIENTTYYIRSILENYLRYAGRCINFADQDALKEYGEYYFLSITYVPDDIRVLMIKINNEMSCADFLKATKLLEEVTPKIHTMLKTM